MVPGMRRMTSSVSPAGSRRAGLPYSRGYCRRTRPGTSNGAARCTGAGRRATRVLDGGGMHEHAEKQSLVAHRDGVTVSPSETAGLCLLILLAAS